MVLLSLNLFGEKLFAEVRQAFKLDQLDLLVGLEFHSSLIFEGTLDS